MPLEYPPQDYFPSSKVRLIIRFEEYGRNVLAPMVPKKTTKNLNGVRDPRSDLVVIADPMAPAGSNRLLLQSNEQSGVGAAQDQDGSIDKLTHILGGIIPKVADWNQNGIRTADSLTATLKFIDCPIDPRVIRSCAIEFYQGAVTAEEYLAGIQGKTRREVFGGDVPNSAEPLNIVPDTYLDDQGRQRSNLRFQGWVDKWTNDWGDDDEPIIELDCRDNTQVLIEQEQPSNLVLSMKDPIDKAMATYLAHFPQLQGMSIEYRPNGESVPILKDSLARASFRPQLGPQPAKGGAGNTKHSIWDYLTDVCGSIGHALFIEGTTIVIQRVRSLYTNQVVNRADDPFQGRVLPSGTQFNYRRFIYGRNVKTMRTSRNFSKKSTKNIEVRSYSTEDKQTVVVRFPLPADRLAYAIPGDASPDQQWTVFRVSGIKDPKTLRAVAQNIYESVGRNELDVELSTDNMASFGGGNTDPDILDMKTGDTFEILVNREDTETSTITRIEQSLLALSRAADFMKLLGFSDDFAQAYAQAYTDAGFQTTFKLRTMKSHWDTETEGITLSLQGVNYIEVRADKLLPTGEEPDDTAGAPRPPQVSGPTPGPPQDFSSP